MMTLLSCRINEDNKKEKEEERSLKIQKSRFT
jgi:hypothetical protein